jgi:hypothetical protein
VRPLDQLLAYWRGELAGEEGEAIEAHVFGCDGCTRKLTGVAELARGVHAVVRGGGLRVALTAAAVDRLARDGLLLRHYRLAPGEQVACTVAAGDDLIVSWLRADLGEAARVDVLWTRPGGEVLARLEDVPLERARGEAILAVGGGEARTWPDTVFVMRLVAVDAGGVDRPLGDYTFNHTAFRPGG